MDVIKLGKKRKLSLPTAVYPVETYTPARLKEFEEANWHTETESARVRKALVRRKR